MASCLVFGASANATITFVFDYNDNNGTTDFLGAENQYRRTALETAGSLFSTYFGSLFSNTATITLGVEGFLQDCEFGCTLAYDESHSVFNAPGFGNSEVVRNKLLSGIDLNGAASDGVIGVNWAAAWELDPSISVAAQGLLNMDFYAAMFHEFTHTLGYDTALLQDGSDGTANGPGVSGLDSAGYWKKFDEFKTDCAGTDLIDKTTGITNDVYIAASTSAMCFNGANAMAANNGEEVQIFAPSEFAFGSTGSHLTDTGLEAGGMMIPYRNFGDDSARTFTDIEAGILMDLGYSRVVAEVPEPGSIALVLLALTGLTIRRRKA